jgi:hypothetical protein
MTRHAEESRLGVAIHSGPMPCLAFTPLVRLVPLGMYADQVQTCLRPRYRWVALFSPRLAGFLCLCVSTLFSLFY